MAGGLGGALLVVLVLLLIFIIIYSRVSGQTLMDIWRDATGR